MAAPDQVVPLSLLPPQHLLVPGLPINVTLTVASQIVARVFIVLITAVRQIPHRFPPILPPLLPHRVPLVPGLPVNVTLTVASQIVARVFIVLITAVRQIPHRFPLVPDLVANVM